MIYAATGTHPAPFDRLARALDAWAIKQGEEVVYQGVLPTVELKQVKQVTLLSPQDHLAMIQRARIVVTHAGPATVMDVLECGKTPVVIPRDPDFGEHVDDHQMRFAERLLKDGGVVSKLVDLERVLLREHMQAPSPQRDPQVRSDATAERVESLVCATVERMPITLWRRGIRWLFLGSP